MTTDAGVKLLDIIDDARDAMVKNRPIVSASSASRSEQELAADVSKGARGAEIEAEPEPEPEPELEAEPEAEPEPEPRTVGDFSGPDRYRALAAATVAPKQDDPMLLPQADEVEPDSELEEVSVLAASGPRVAEPVDEKVRKAILGETIAAATQDDVVLDDEDIVELADEDAKPHTSPTERELAKGLVAAENLSSEELLSRMEDFLNFETAAHSADNALDSTEAWATHYTQDVPEPDDAVQAAGDLQHAPPTTPERSTTITISVMCPLDCTAGQAVTIDTDYGAVVVTVPADVEPGDMFEAEVAVLNDGADAELRPPEVVSPAASLDDLYEQMQVTGSPKSMSAPTDDVESAPQAMDPAEATDEERFLAEQEALGLSSEDSAGEELQQQLQHENGSFDPGDQPSLMVSVVCPEGVLPGMDIIVEGPDGRDVVVQVPSGVAAGDEFTVEVGAAGGLVSVSSAQKMTVTVPEGSSGGEAILVETPDGRELEVIVPDGLTAGEEFEFEFEG